MILDASAFVVGIAGGTLEPLIRDAELTAPDLLVSEVLNAYWKIGRSGGRCPPRDTVLALVDRIMLVPSRPYAGRAAELAEKIDHPVYDCLYLAVAEAYDDVLLTADERLSRKVRGKLRNLVRLLPK